MTDRKSSRPRLPEAERIAVVNLRGRALEYVRAVDTLNAHVAGLGHMSIETTRPVDVQKFRALHKRLSESSRALEQAALVYSAARKGKT